MGVGPGVGVSVGPGVGVSVGRGVGVGGIVTANDAVANDDPELTYISFWP